MAIKKPASKPAKKPFDHEKPREWSTPAKKPAQKPSPFSPNPINPAAPVIR